MLLRHVVVSLFVALLLSFSLLFSGAFASNLGGDLYSSEGEAYQACIDYANEYPAFVSGGPASCRSVATSSSTGLIGFSASCPGTTPNYTGVIQPVAYNWCTTPVCVPGTSPGGQNDYAMSDPGGYIGGGGVVDQNGCCATLVLQQGSWSLSNKSDAVAIGHFVLNGNRCQTSYGASSSGGTIPVAPRLVPYQNCPSGSKSCFNPTQQKFCAQSESGEWFCEPKSAPDPGGCISGATGALCVGKNGAPPPPPDPPISSGTPPDSTGNVTINDGGTVNNYTTNNYSGTSPGGSGSSPPSSSPGGTGTNTGGSGNSGQKGTDANGNCPDGSKPTASGCSGTYRDGGCDVPPQCYGDAVLCGIAANTHKSACAASGSTAGPPGSMTGDPTSNGGDPSSSSVSNSVDLGAGAGGLDAGGFGYSSACPLTDGLHFTFLGKSIDVDTSSMCTPLSFIYYIVLAFAYFTAAKIMAGVK